MNKVRVLIETTDKRGDVCNSEISFSGNSMGETVGLAVAGALNGVCVYEDPDIFDVFREMMRHLDLRCDFLRAVSTALVMWHSPESDMEKYDYDIDQVARVCLREGAIIGYAWQSVSVDEEAWSGLDATQRANVEKQRKRLTASSVSEAKG